jgi:hypothetical protein
LFVIKFWPYEGIISLICFLNLLFKSFLEKHCSITLIIESTATEAPGEAPRRAAIFLFFEMITSVPNSNLPLINEFGLIIWTRWPAILIDQSFSFADSSVM